MADLHGTLALVSDDPALRRAVAALLRADGDTASLLCLSPRDGAAALTLTAAGLVLIDAESCADPVGFVAAAVLFQAAPLVVLGTRLSPASGVGAACRAQGAALIWTKASGPAAPALAGAEGLALRRALAALLPSGQEG